ncbi:MAG: hypothetical protein A2Z28_03415 [Chloroflexi bacterium RBG_16_51_9]|nr:MAG: hypothetical protein A2Z28_03415 [Chloroflexi bacterium RBG_16_51_9]
MGSLKQLHGRLEDLHCKAKNLAETGLALTNLFAEEAGRLNRCDEASRLRKLCFSIRRQLDSVKSGEDAASCGYSQANLIVSLGGLAVGGMIKMASRSKQLSALADYLLKNPTDKECPFGLILICIGPRGLPDDAGVVSISQLARESSRPESEIINKLQEGGYLLFNEKTFSLLIDRLIDDVREGRLYLPISREKLSEITASGELNLDLRK